MKNFIAFILAVIFSVDGYTQTEVYFVHNDHLSTPQAITDSEQNIVWEGDYSPFGEVESLAGDFDQPLRFPGQYADLETGYHYNYYRDYDPSLGRYIQSDPIGIAQDYSDPQMQLAIQMGIPLQSPVEGINHVYGYVDQNPIMFFDPFGLKGGQSGRNKKPQSCRSKCIENFIGNWGAGIATGVAYTALGGSAGLAYAAGSVGLGFSTTAVAACIDACDDDKDDDEQCK